MNYEDSEAMALNIIEEIHYEYGVNIVSAQRDRYTTDLRKMFCTYVYRNTRMTMHNIAEILQKSVGNVSYYLSMHDRQMGESSSYADNYSDFQDRIKKSATI
jgi:hypothetical protein